MDGLHASMHQMQKRAEINKAPLVGLPYVHATLTGNVLHRMVQRTMLQIVPLVLLSEIIRSWRRLFMSSHNEAGRLMHVSEGMKILE